MKTYNLEFTPTGDTANGRKREIYSFTLDADSNEYIGNIRDTLMNQAFFYFKWFGAGELAKYGKTYKGSWDRTLSYKEFRQIAEDNGFTMKFYEEIE